MLMLLHVMGNFHMCKDGYLSGASRPCHNLNCDEEEAAHKIITALRGSAWQKDKEAGSCSLLCVVQNK